MILESLNSLIDFLNKTSKSILWILFFVTLGIGVTLLALSRSQVGRESLKKELQAQFNQEFYGQLAIQKLEGDLLYNLYAKNVILKDDQGRSVLHVDSVAIHPDWFSLLDNTLQINEINLFRPTLLIEQDKTGHWNIEAVFKSRKKTNSPSPKRLDISSAALKIYNGKVQLQNPNTKPKAIQKGDVFDFTNLNIQNLNLNSSFELTTQGFFVDLIEFNAFLPQQNFHIKALQAQLLQLDNTLSINGLQLETAASQIAMFGKIIGVKHFKKLNLAELNKSQFNLALQTFTIAPQELKSFLPKVKIPSFKLSAIVNGNPNNLQINRLNFQQNQTQIQGNIQAKITQERLNYKLALADNPIYLSDVALWAPKAELNPFFNLGKLTISTNLEGAYTFKTEALESSGFLNFKNDILGSIVGNLAFKNAPQLHYLFDGTVNQLNLDALKQKDITGKINGTIKAEGQGIAVNNRDMSLNLNLNNSQFRDLQLNQLNANVRLINQEITGLITTQTNNGGLAVNGKIDLSNPNAAVEIALDANQLQLAKFLPNEKRIKNVSGKITLKGHGNSVNDFVGTALTDVKVASVYGDITLKADIVKQNVAARWQDFLGKAIVDMQLNSVNGNAKIKGLIAKKQTQPEVDLTATIQEFNLTKFFPKQPSTRLNGNYQLKGKGADLEHFAGNLEWEMQPSSIFLSEKNNRIPAHQGSLDLKKTGKKEAIILALKSELADVFINTKIQSNLLNELQLHWRAALTRTLEAENRKTLYATPNDTTDWTQSLEKGNQFIAKLIRQQVEPFTADGRIALKKPAMLQSYFPDIKFAIPFNAAFETYFGAEKLGIEAQIVSDSLHQKDLYAQQVALNLSAHATYQNILTHSLKLHSSLSAKRAIIAGQEVYNIGTDFDFNDKLGTFVLHADSLKGIGAMDFAANIALLEKYNQLTIQSFILNTPREQWEIPQNQIVAFYTDALVLKNVFVDRHDINPRVPVYTVKAHGILSENPQDAITIAAEQVELRDVSELLNTKPKLKGLFTGEIKISDGLKKPKITGEAKIVGFSLKDKYLPEFMNVGDLTLEAIANPEDRENLDLKLLIRQPRKPEPLFVSENEVMATGQIKLPLGKNADGSPNKGKINIDVAVERLDLFFFKMLFPGEIDKPIGYGYGNAKIEGDFSTPIFNADLQIARGQFIIPEFNLKPSIAGRLTVDKEGFHLHKMLLKDTGTGTAVVNGDILFNNYRFFSFNLSGELDAFEIINVPQSKTLDFYGHLWASGNMTLIGPLDHTVLTAQNVVTTANSELFIPIFGGSVSRDETFVVFADSLGRIPQRRNRTNLLGNRPPGERTFLDGLEMKMNISAPQGAKVNLVFDQLLGDMIEAKGSGNIKMDYLNGEFKLFGKFNVSGGDYLFTVQDFGIRRPFKLDPGGTMEWTGDPVNAKLNIPASYPKRVSTNGLPGSQNEFLDLIVRMNISGEVNVPLVNLKLEIDKKNAQFSTANDRKFETELNRPERASVYATSVLLSDSFTPAAALLTQSGFTLGDTQQVVYNSLFQLASNFINKVLNQLTPNVDVNVGVSQQYQTQGTDRISDLGLSLGVAWRIFDDKIVLRGQGVVDNTSNSTQNNNQLEFAANYRIRSNLSTEVFYRNDNSPQTTNPFRGQTIGASLLYNRNFSNWHYFFTKPDSLSIK